MSSSEDRTAVSRSKLSTKGAGSSMRLDRVGGMSTEVTLNSMCAARVSSRRLPYLPRVKTAMVSMRDMFGGGGW